MIFGSFPAFNPHWEVWGLTLAIIVGGIWVAKVIGPEFVGPDEKVISRRQATFFLACHFHDDVGVGLADARYRGVAVVLGAYVAAFCFNAGSTAAVFTFMSTLVGRSFC